MAILVKWAYRAAIVCQLFLASLAATPLIAQDEISRQSQHTDRVNAAVTKLNAEGHQLSLAVRTALVDEGAAILALSEKYLRGEMPIQAERASLAARIREFASRPPEQQSESQRNALDEERRNLISDLESEGATVDQRYVTFADEVEQAFAARSQPQPLGTIAWSEGETFALSLGSTTPRRLKTNDVVYTTDNLSTGANGSLEVRLSDATTFKVGSNTTRVVLDIYPARSVRTIEQTVQGVFEYISSRGEKNIFQTRVRLRMAWIAVRGTHFIVDVAADLETKVTVFEGIVEYTPDDTLTPVALAAGEQITITPAGSHSLRKADLTAVASDWGQRGGGGWSLNRSWQWFLGKSLLARIGMTVGAGLLILLAIVVLNQIATDVLFKKL